MVDYCVTHPDATKWYMQSDMVLRVHSDVSYLSESQARSRYGGIFLGAQNLNQKDNNGAILAISKIIKNVM